MHFHLNFDVMGRSSDLVKVLNRAKPEPDTHDFITGGFYTDFVFIDEITQKALGKLIEIYGLRLPALPKDLQTK